MKTQGMFLLGVAQPLSPLKKKGFASNWRPKLAQKPAPKWLFNIGYLEATGKETGGFMICSNLLVLGPSTPG